MATLTDEVKVFIVQALACFDSPSQVAQAVKDQFGPTEDHLALLGLYAATLTGRY
jgi:hypothetical protein